MPDTRLAAQIPFYVAIGVWVLLENRWVRHPSYTGLTLTFLGIGLALGNWAALIVLAVLPTAGLVVRIRFEERALLDGLGEPYRRFAASRARLFPGLW